MTEAAASVFPTRNESEFGVKEVTDALVEAVEELPVEDSTFEELYPVIS